MSLAPLVALVLSAVLVRSIALVASLALVVSAAVVHSPGCVCAVGRAGALALVRLVVLFVSVGRVGQVFHAALVESVESFCLAHAGEFRVGRTCRVGCVRCLGRIGHVGCVGLVGPVGRGRVRHVDFALLFVVLVASFVTVMRVPQR